MAQVKQRRRNLRQQKQARVSPFRNYWTSTNYYLLGAGVLLVILGFFLMTVGKWDGPVALSVSTIVLLLAYLVVFPAAIFYGKKEKLKEVKANDVSENNR